MSLTFSLLLLVLFGESIETFILFFFNNAWLHHFLLQDQEKVWMQTSSKEGFVNVHISVDKHPSSLPM